MAWWSMIVSKNRGPGSKCGLQKVNYKKLQVPDASSGMLQIFSFIKIDVEGVVDPDLH